MVILGHKRLSKSNSKIIFIKERKAEVTSGKYGMTQIVLKPNLEVYTMSPQNFFNTYQNIV